MLILPGQPAATQRSCVQCTKFLDSALNHAESHGTFKFRSPMRQSAAAPNSGLPSLMMPCPACAGRMVYNGRRAIAADVEDTVYACRNCGAELVRTSIRSTKPGKTKPAAAA
jgi:hypothetical protein